MPTNSLFNWLHLSPISNIRIDAALLPCHVLHEHDMTCGTSEISNHGRLEGQSVRKNKQSRPSQMVTTTGVIFHPTGFFADVDHKMQSMNRSDLS